MSELYININNTRLIRQMSNDYTTPIEKHVLEVMGGFAHDDGTSIKVGIPRLIKYTGYSDKWIRKKIKSLVNKGLLIQTLTPPSGSHKPHEYRLNLDLINSYQEPEQISSAVKSTAVSSARVPRYEVPRTPVFSTGVPRYCVPVNKYVTSNEEVNEQVPLASSSDDVCFVSNTTKSERTNFKAKSRSKPKYSEPNPANDEAFNQIWSAWLRKADKKRAREAFDKAVPNKVSVKKISETAEAYLKHLEIKYSNQGDRQQYCKSLKNWINDECWDDSYEPVNLKSVKRSDDDWINNIPDISRKTNISGIDIKDN